MRNLLTLCSLVLFVLGALPNGAGARTADPQDPVLVGRIAHIEGNLLRYIEEDKDWVRTVRDAPFGLEDSLFIRRGQLAESNAQQVAKIRRIVEELGYEIATPEEARATLGLKGGDRVNF